MLGHAKGMEIVIDGMVFDSIQDYRKYRQEQDRLKLLAESQAIEEATIKKNNITTVSGDRTRLPPASGNNPFIAENPDESQWKTIIIDPNQEKAHQAKIVSNSIEGQIDQIKKDFEESVEHVEKDKVKKKELKDAINKVAQSSGDNALLLMSNKEKINLYHYDDPVLDKESDATAEETEEAFQLENSENEVSNPAKTVHPAIYQEIYGAE